MNGIKTTVLKENTSVYIMGCPCHIIHNTAIAGNKASVESSGFDVGDFAVDNFYWLDKSSKRKNLLLEFCELVDIKYRNILDHISVRWLSLEKVVDHLLLQYPALKSMYLFQEEPQPRFKRLKLKAWFEDPMTEVYLKFHQSVIPTFTRFNLALQSEESSIFLLEEEMTNFPKRLCGKFLSLDELRNNSNLLNADIQNQLPNDNLFVGYGTRLLLEELENSGLEPKKIRQFYTAVRRFYEEAFNYAKEHLPFNDPVLKHAKFVDFGKRMQASFESVEYFVKIYKDILHFDPAKFDSLYDEFVAYQLLQDSDFPEKVINDTTFVSKDSGGNKVTRLRMDIIWGNLSEDKDSCGIKRFPKLSSAALLVLTLLHSNADEEHVFSLIKKNKTEFRGSLDLNRTLSSIITVKMNLDGESHQFRPSASLIKKSKSSTGEYNRLHKKTTTLSRGH